MFKYIMRFFTKRYKSITRVILLIAAMSSSVAFAFKYDEHYTITSAAFAETCSELRHSYSQKDGYSRLCQNNLFSKCYSHFAAVAGDILANADQFYPNNSFLRGGSKKNGSRLDCGVTFSSLLNGKKRGRDQFKKTPEKLGNPILRNLAIVSNATSNHDHFMPYARDRFYEIQSELYQNLAIDTLEQLGKHALALHFLQDAYSAGHNGIKRSGRQDYDHAYHDDLNHYGLFLSDKHGKEWFTYGDGKLNEDVFIIEQFDKIVQKRDLKKFLNLAVSKSRTDYNSCPEHTSCDVNASKKLSRLLQEKDVDEIWKSLPSAKGGNVISIPFPAGLELLSPCYYSDGCDKLEVILADKEYSCSKKKTLSSKGQASLVTCNDGKAKVQHASKIHIKNLLLRLLTQEAQASGLVGIEPVPFPKAYRTLNGSVTGRGINKVPLIALYDTQPWPYPDQSKAFQPRELQFTNWGFSVAKLSSEVVGQDRNALYWTLRIPFVSEYEAKTNFYDAGRMELRFEVVNDEDRILDRIDSSLFSPSLRSNYLFKNIIGLNLKTTVGVDNLWDESTRNIFAGVGIGADVHLGKHTFFIELERSKHYHASDDKFYSSRVFVGWRATSIDLAPSRSTSSN